MNIPLELLIFIFSVLLGVIGYFLNRILTRITAYEEKIHELDIQCRLNRNDIDCIRSSAC